MLRHIARSFQLAAHAHRDPPRLANRRFAAGQRERPHARHALELAALTNQKLAAPNRAVRSIAGAVPRHAEHPPVEPTVFQHAGRHMGVVMLHGQPRHGLPRRPLRRKIIRVQVVHQQRRPKPVQPQHILQVRQEPLAGRQRLLIAHVRPQHALRSVRPRDRGLQVTAQRDRGRSRAANRAAAAPAPAQAASSPAARRSREPRCRRSAARSRDRDAATHRRCPPNSFPPIPPGTPADSPSRLALVHTSGRPNSLARIACSGVVGRITPTVSTCG